MRPAYPFTLAQLTNNVALILPPKADQCRSKISPLSASETFTQRRVWRIDTGSPHANGSVNGDRAGTAGGAASSGEASQVTSSPHV